MKTKVATDRTQSAGAEDLARLKREYPDATSALHHSNALELVVATILSAQCTDAAVNMVTPHLFAKYARRQLRRADRVCWRKRSSPPAFSGTRPNRSSGWRRRSSSGMAARFRNDGELTACPAWAANGERHLGTWFGKTNGVSTRHVHRLSRLLGLTRRTIREDRARPDGDRAAGRLDLVLAHPDSPRTRRVYRAGGRGAPTACLIGSAELAGMSTSQSSRRAALTLRDATSTSTRAGVRRDAHRELDQRSPARLELPGHTGIGRRGVVGLKRMAVAACCSADMDALPVEEAEAVPYRSTQPGRCTPAVMTGTSRLASRSPAPARSSSGEREVRLQRPKKPPMALRR